MSLKIARTAVATSHILYSLLVLAVIPLMLTDSLSGEWQLFAGITIGAASLLYMLCDVCPLTLIQQKIEKRLGHERPVKEFVREYLARIGIQIPNIVIARTVVILIALDLSFLLFN